MSIQNFWFSYKNILRNEFIKKKYFSLSRKIIGVLSKFIIRFFRHKFSINCTNLDKLDIEDFLDYELNDLFIKFNCDKGSYFIQDQKKILSHNYSAFYEKYFKPFKNKKINLLELGSHEGKGLASFFFYFSNSKLYGANINPFQMRFESIRITELFVDVSNQKILNSLSHHLKRDFDIIIDDASHNLRDIIITFLIFFKKLKSKGVYVIEDINQLKVFKELNPYKNEITPIEILKKIQKKEHFQSSFLTENDKEYLFNNIESIKIEKGSMIIEEENVSEIAFIFKK
tara:strand:+ start:385 stop:1242 length:858 start_codon:yes stop_codon:yes gene_type:complete